LQEIFIRISIILASLQVFPFQIPFFKLLIQNICKTALKSARLFRSYLKTEIQIAILKLKRVKNH
jgi:hypothetical protein